MTPTEHAMTQPDIDAFYRLAAARRDIGNGFLPDPVSDDVLTRVLAAAHQAPSVGLSQPWDFLLVRDREVRERVHALASRQREAFARSLPRSRALAFRDLKIEAILDTPVNIVVTCDPTRGGRHVLGRHAQPRVAKYSSVCAVQNLWLAARAEGLGAGRGSGHSGRGGWRGAGASAPRRCPSPPPWQCSPPTMACTPRG